jgi:MarR family transcriptional regulator, negative regulator of the multidrug operon emrRAB
MTDMCGVHMLSIDICARRTYPIEMEDRIANLLGALALAVIDRVEAAARATLQHGGETPAALVVIGYSEGMTNDTLRRILCLSHPGAVRLVDRLVADRLVRRRPGRDGREVALHLTERGSRARSQLLASRIEAIRPLIATLGESDQAQFEVLLHRVLAAMETREMQRYTICRLCDDRVCENCPLPTSRGRGT